MIYKFMSQNGTLGVPPTAFILSLSGSLCVSLSVLFTVSPTVLLSSVSEGAESRS